MEDIFYSDDESMDLDSMYDLEEDDITGSIDLFQTACCDFDIQVDRVNITQYLDPSFHYDFSRQHLYMAQPLETQTVEKAENKASLVSAKINM